MKPIQEIFRAGTWQKLTYSGTAAVDPPAVDGPEYSTVPQSIPKSVKRSVREKSGPKASKSGKSKSKMSPSFSDSEEVLVPLPSPLVFSKLVGTSELSKSSLPLTCSLLLCHLLVLTGEEKVHWFRSMENCLVGLTMMVLEEIIVQLVGVVSGGVLSCWDLAVEETSSRGEMDLSL